MDSGRKVIALAGNPNVGKSTIFNVLTGLKQHTGNWPGKTVVNATGQYKYKDINVSVIDLPGTYSLLASSQEEEIARNFICFEQTDVIVVVSDATALERNLNLFLQIAELSNNVVLCVNFLDEAKKKGIYINKQLLEKKLKSKVIFTTAIKNKGIDELKDVIIDNTNKVNNIISIDYGENIEWGIREISKIILNLGNIKDNKIIRWISLRLLEGNNKLVKKMIDEFNIKSKDIIKILGIKNKVINMNNGLEIEEVVVNKLIKTAENLCKKSVIKNKKESNTRKKIDKILVSKSFGIPIMISLLLLVLWLTIIFANYPSQLLSDMFRHIERIIRSGYIYSIMPKWLSGVLIDGIYTTLTWVISVMLPPMAIFFPMFSLLEDAGYLPRIAFNLDRCFKGCGACGKQALTMCMGFGCNAVGVIGCRIINSKKEKLIAILTNVFVPCNGRFPILITISTLFIGGMFIQGLLPAVTVTIVIIIGILFTLIISKVLSITLLKSEKSTFILELPQIRKPQIKKVILRSLIDRTLKVLFRAVVVAIPAGIVIWVFANIKLGNISLLSYCANFLDPFGSILGLDGYIIMAFILGMPANEIVMPILIMSYLKTNIMVEIKDLSSLKELFISNGWNMITAINTMVLCLLHYPCATTIITIKKETGSNLWTILAVILPTLVGIISCFIIKQIFG